MKEDITFRQQSRIKAFRVFELVTSEESPVVEKLNFGTVKLLFQSPLKQSAVLKNK